jgi:nicotinamide mononucleotide transporter
MGDSTSNRIEFSLELVVEIIAVTCSLLYTWMYLKGLLPGAYIPAAIGAGSFAVLCWKRKIYAESFLQVFYIAMAGYGAWLTLFVTTTESIVWVPNQHLFYIIASAIGTLSLGLVLKKYTSSSIPFVDSFTTVFGVVATWLMIHLVHENWIYWIVINSVSIYLYYRRKLYLGALLFIVYLLLALDGYFEAITIF